MVFQNCFITARGKSKIETTGVRSSKFQFIQQVVCKFIFPSKFKMGSMFCDNRGQTSLKRHVTFKEFTPPVIIFSLATAQQTLLILCSVRVSFVLRLHSDAIQVLERLKSPQFKLKLELIVKMAQLSRSFATNCRTKCYFSRACQRRQQLIPLNSWVYSITKHQRDINVSQTCVSFEKKLILARTGVFGDFEGRNFKICLQYRAQLGVRFGPSGS